MQRRYFTAIQRAVSDPRLNAFRSAEATDQEALASYFWNVSLCEAFYPSLHMVEIAFRNALNSTISAVHGAHWFEDHQVLISSHGQRDIAKAKEELKSQGKAAEPGRIVAALDFGFWTSLLGREYHDSLQRGSSHKPLWPYLLDFAFPSVPPEYRYRKRLAERAHESRRFRNRVFHHEPINRKGDLVEKHRQITDLLTWISPSLHESLRKIDRVEATLNSGPDMHRHWIAELDRLYGPSAGV